MMTYNLIFSTKSHRKKLVRKLEEKQAKLERQLEVEKKKLEEEQRKLDNERKIFETERLKLAQGATTPAEESVQFFIYLHESWVFRCFLHAHVRFFWKLHKLNISGAE